MNAKIVHGVLLDKVSLAADDLDLQPLWDLPITWHVYETTTTEETVVRLQDAAIALTNKVVLTAEHLQQLPNLRLIIIMATGINNVDLIAAKQQGIAVCNISDYSTDSVVQHTIGVMLALHMRLFEYRTLVEQGKWQQSHYFGLLDHQVQQVAGKTLGIVGFGKIGQGVAKVAAALGMRVDVATSLRKDIYHSTDDSEVSVDKYPRYPLEELLPRVDVLSVHCPLTEQTRDLIDVDAIVKMKSTAMLINVSRGGIVNEKALLDALKRQALAGAAIDVLTQEPPKDGNVLLEDILPNLIVTPHTAWAAQQSRQCLVDKIALTLKAYLAGKLLENQVN